MPLRPAVYHLRHGSAATPGALTTRPGWGALGPRAQGEAHGQADGVLDAQDPEDAGLGQRAGRTREGDPGLEPDRGTGRPRISCGTNAAQGKRAVLSDPSRR